MNSRPIERAGSEMADSQVREQSVALVVAVIFTAIVAVVCFFLNRVRFPLNPDILETHVSLLSLDSTEYQKRFYVLMVLALATTCLVVAKGWIKPEKLISELRSRALVVVFFTIVFLYSDWEPKNYPGFGLVAFTLLLLSESKLTPGISNLIPNPKRLRLLNGFMLLVLCVLFAVLWLRPLQFPVAISSLSELIWVDGHYSVTVLSGYDLLQADSGNQLKSVGYGIGVPTFTALCLGVGYFFSDTTVSLPTVVKIYQLVAVLLIAGIFYVRDKRIWLLGTLIVLVTLAFTLANTGTAVKFPNQSGIRYIPLLLGFLGVAYELSKDRFRVWFLSLLGGSLLLLNIETGLAFSSGVIAALFYKELAASKGVVSPLFKVAKFVAAESIVFLVLASVFIPLLLPKTENFLNFLTLFGTSGYGGLKARLSLTACVVMISAAFTLVDTAYVARERTLNQKGLWEVFLAAVMLVWMTYYMNRMDEWNLWFHWIPLILWFFSRFSAELMAATSRSIDCFPDLTFSSMFLVVLTSAVTFGQAFDSASSTVLPAMKDVAKSIIRPKVPSEATYNLAGFEIVGDAGYQVRAHIEGLQPFNKRDALVFSNLPTLVRLQGFNGYAPMYSPMSVVTHSQIPESRQAILQSGFHILVFDGPNTLTSTTYPELKRQIDLLLGTNTSSMSENHGEWSVLELKTLPPL
jgi:hypothetical protein